MSLPYNIRTSGKFAGATTCKYGRASVSYGDSTAVAVAMKLSFSGSHTCLVELIAVSSVADLKKIGRLVSMALSYCLRGKWPSLVRGYYLSNIFIFHSFCGKPNQSEVGFNR